MNTIKNENYFFNEAEYEQASNSYLMSVVAIIGGLPLPIFNLIATLIFYFYNRKKSHFIRWHCTQALLMQLFLFIINSINISWTLRIVFGSAQLTNNYIAYLICVIIFNIVDLFITIKVASKVRNGETINLWFFTELTHLICKK
jgi:uncharacterized Tic20 family protein